MYKWLPCSPDCSIDDNLFMLILYLFKCDVGVNPAAMTIIKFRKQFCQYELLAYDLWISRPVYNIVKNEKIKAGNQYFLLFVKYFQNRSFPS